MTNVNQAANQHLLQIQTHWDFTKASNLKKATYQRGITQSKPFYGSPKFQAGQQASLLLRPGGAAQTYPDIHPCRKTGLHGTP